MYNPKLEALATEIKKAISVEVAKFHDQVNGIRITDMNIESEVLNPPGIKYIIKLGVQITFPAKKDTP